MESVDKKYIDTVTNQVEYIDNILLRLKVDTIRQKISIQNAPDFQAEEEMNDIQNNVQKAELIYAEISMHKELRSINANISSKECSEINFRNFHVIPEKDLNENLNMYTEKLGSTWNF